MKFRNYIDGATDRSNIDFHKNCEYDYWVWRIGVVNVISVWDHGFEI